MVGCPGRELLEALCAFIRHLQSLLDPRGVRQALPMLLAALPVALADGADSMAAVAARRHQPVRPAGAGPGPGRRPPPAYGACLPGAGGRLPHACGDRLRRDGHPAPNCPVHGAHAATEFQTGCVHRAAGRPQRMSALTLVSHSALIATLRLLWDSRAIAAGPAKYSPKSASNHSSGNSTIYFKLVRSTGQAQDYWSAKRCCIGRIQILLPVASIQGVV